MAMGMMVGQGVRQGYSRMNDGYNEQPGINWGRVGAYAGGTALGYGVIRAGAMKLKKSGHLQNAWGSMGRITGMSRPGGWKGFQELGASLIPQKEVMDKAMKQRTIQAAKAQRAGREATLAKRAARRQLPKIQAAGERSLEKAETLARRAMGYYDDSGYRGNYHPEDIGGYADYLTDARARAPGQVQSRRIGYQQENLLAGTQRRVGAEAALERSVGHLQRGEALLSGVESAASHSSSEIAKLRGMSKGRMVGKFTPHGLGGALSGAAGFFGAMDYAKAGGLTRLGVGAARTGLALGAVGLGMKALSWLNPFSDR